MNEGEFEEFYRRSVRRIIGVTYAACGDLEEAQDCVQEAFASAWSRRSRLDPARSPEAFVQVTAVRLAVSRWRRKGAFLRAVARSGPPPTSVEGPDVGSLDLVPILRSLPPATRLVVTLHYVADWPVAEIAEHLEMNPNTVKSHLLRGRTALRERLPRGDEPLPEGTPRTTNDTAREGESRHV